MKEIIKRKQAIDQKNFFVNHVSIKDLSLEYTKNSQNSAIRKQST